MVCLCSNLPLGSRLSHQTSFISRYTFFQNWEPPRNELILGSFENSSALRPKQCFSHKTATFQNLSLNFRQATFCVQAFTDANTTSSIKL